MRFYLGIDTSNYTTSLCLMSDTGELAADVRQVLSVAQGERGLRQSEAVFQHIRNLPVLTKQLQPFLTNGNEIVAVGVSAKPRPQPDSYMPVFLPGYGLALSLANLGNIPYYELTHQENHIWGGIKTAGGPVVNRFLAIHLSGGTTELCSVFRDEQFRFSIKVLGGTTDLHAGQFVDRIGVALGLPFPAGKHLEKLALQTTSQVTVPSFHREGKVSFSGPMTALLRHIDTASPSEIARGCFTAISRSLVKWIRWAGEQTECRDLLIVGGVASNSIIREHLLEKMPEWNIFFAEPSFSTDNAYGAAFYAGLAHGSFHLD